MAMEERNLEIVLDALAEKIKSLETDIMLKDMDISCLKEKNKRLEAENAELYNVLTERGEKNGTH